MIFRCLLTTFRHPFQRFGRKRQINRLFGLLHGYRQTVLSSIDEDIFPLQTDDIAYPQSAEAGEQISLFYGLVFHRSSNQCPHLFNGHIRPFTLRQTDFIRIVDLRKRIDFYNFRSHGCVQGSVQNAIIGV